MRFKVGFETETCTVALEGEYTPPRIHQEGWYGHFQVERGTVVTRDPLQLAIADGIDGHSLDAVVGRAMARVGRATW